MEKEPVLYEIGYLLKDDLKDEEVLDFSEKTRNKMTDQKGLIIVEGKPKRQLLAYPVKKQTSAVFNWIKFLLNPDFLKEIKKYFNDQKEILRFLIIKTPKEKPAKPPRTRIIRKEKIPVLFKPAMKELTEKPTEEQPAEKKEKIKEEEIDKKLEELLGE